MEKEKFTATFVLLILFPKDQNEEIWLYCLERLLKGLASSRQASRLGFAVAFVEVKIRETWRYLAIKCNFEPCRFFGTAITSPFNLY